jgi:uncharacterized protein (DUF885 family)
MQREDWFMHRRNELTRRDVLMMLGATAASPFAPVASARAVTGTIEQSAALRALIEASDAAASRLDPIPRVAPDWSTGTPPFVDPLGNRYWSQHERQVSRDIAGLRKIDPAALSPIDQLAYAAFKYRTERESLRLRSGVAEIERFAPLNASSGLHIELPDYVAGAGAPFNTTQDYEAGLERLAGFAGYLASLVQWLNRGASEGYFQPQTVVAKVAAQATAILELPRGKTPFHAALDRFPATFSERVRGRFATRYERAIAREVLPRYAGLRDFLTNNYLPHANRDAGRWAMRDGAKVYAYELDHHTTLASNADAIHALGLEEVAELRASMKEVRGKVGFRGDLPEFFDFVRRDPQFYYTRGEDLIARMQDIEQRIWSGMPRLFARKPRAPFAVRALPAIGSQRGTGYYRPGPPDGVTPGVLWFNMAMLNTRPIPTLETLTLHEGIPGHHYQITLVLEDAALPPILRFGGLTAYSEGWGLYAESLGPELGMFEDPYQLFGHLDMAMLRAVRLVVDTGLHAKQWSRQRAIDYMLANTSMAPRDVEVEIDRYITWPGQACAYKVGELKIRGLRSNAESKLGSRFDVRQFHAQVLDTGALPLEVLDTKLSNWLAAQA